MTFGPGTQTPLLLLIISLVTLYVKTLYVLDTPDQTCTIRPKTLLFPKNFRIFDTFMYNGESHILLNRLLLLDQYVDRWYIAVSPTTHSGINRTLDHVLSFSPLRPEIEPFMDRFEIFTVYLSQFVQNREKSWARTYENHNGIQKYLQKQHLLPTDIILSTDVDEIPSIKSMNIILKSPPTGYVPFIGNSYLYTYRYISTIWYGPFVIRWDAVEKDFSDYRNLHPKLEDFHYDIDHCTYCFPTIGQMSKKLKENAHTEYSIEPYIDPNYIYAHVICGIDLFHTVGMPGKKLISVSAINASKLVAKHPKLVFLTKIGGYTDLDTISLDKIWAINQCPKGTIPSEVQLPIQRKK